MLIQPKFFQQHTGFCRRACCSGRNWLGRYGGLLGDGLVRGIAEPDHHRSDSHLLVRLGQNLEHITIAFSFDLDNRLVRFHRGDGLTDFDEISDVNTEFHNTHDIVIVVHARSIQGIRHT